MAGIVWNRDPQEAINNPYEYNAQKQFHREAIYLTDKLSKILIIKKKYSLQDKTLEKATWMLQTDALNAFKDAVLLLEMKKHRVVGRLLRDMLETVHLTEYLNSGYIGSEEALKKWFDDEPIMHNKFRNYIKQVIGENLSNVKREEYITFSKFTHRTYKILLYGYARLENDEMYYDEQWTLPQTISMYYAILGMFGRLVIDNLKSFGILDIQEIDDIWHESMEEFSIPRGYLSKEDKEFLGIDG